MAFYNYLTTITRLDKKSGDGAGRELRDLSRTAVAALVDALRDPDKDVRKEAATALAAGRDAELAVPGLAMVLRDQDHDIAGAAFNSLRKFHRDARAALPVLLDILREKDAPGAEFRRWRAIEVVGEIGPDAASAVPFLKEALTNENVWTRLEAASALAKVGQPLPQALTVATNLLVSGDDDALRARAAGVIGDLAWPPCPPFPPWSRP